MMICSCASASRRNCTAAGLPPARAACLILVASGDVGRHGERNAAKQLNPLGNDVHQQHLAFVALVVHEVQLVEGRAHYLPVMLLVHVAQRDRGSQALVQQRHALLAQTFLRQPVGELDDFPYRCVSWLC